MGNPVDVLSLDTPFLLSCRLCRSYTKCMNVKDVQFKHKQIMLRVGMSGASTKFMSIP